MFTGTLVRSLLRMLKDPPSDSSSISVGLLYVPGREVSFQYTGPAMLRYSHWLDVRNDDALSLAVEGACWQACQMFQEA